VQGTEIQFTPKERKYTKQWLILESISIKTSRGYQNGHIFRWVRLSGSKTYTKNDIDKIKKGKLIFNLVLIETGLTGRIAFTIVATTIAVSQAVREYYTHDTKWDKSPPPKAGQKVRLKIHNTKDNNGALSLTNQPDLRYAV
jgi:hypothetical protein